MSEFSQKRLEARIAEIISTLIVSRQIKNHNLSTLTSVSEVRLAEDNTSATVFCSSLLNDGSLERSVQALNEASAFIQARLAKNLKTKNTPVLTFKADSREKEAAKVNTIIDRLMKEMND